MKAHDSLANFDLRLEDIQSNEFSDHNQATFQLAASRTKFLADRPTPDDWPTDD